MGELPSPERTPGKVESMRFQSMLQGETNDEREEDV